MDSKNLSLFFEAYCPVDARVRRFVRCQDDDCIAVCCECRFRSRIKELKEPNGEEKLEELDRRYKWYYRF